MDGSQPTLGFQDFDNEDVFSKVEASVYHADTLNFVIDFDVDKAEAATNLSSDAVSKLLAVEVRLPYGQIRASRLRYN